MIKRNKVNLIEKREKKKQKKSISFVIFLTWFYLFINSHRFIEILKLSHNTVLINDDISIIITVIYNLIVLKTRSGGYLAFYP